MALSLLQDLRNQIKQEQAILRNPVVKAVLAVATKARRMKNVDVNVSISWGGSLRIYVNELDGFKDRRLVSILERLQNVIMELKTEDEPEYRRRSFTARIPVERPDSWSTFDVTVSAYLKDAPRRCKIIEIDRHTEVIPARQNEVVRRIFVCD